jgi:hypothetical protein
VTLPRQPVVDDATRQPPAASSVPTLKSAAEPGPVILPAVVGDRYRLVARLGGGGMAQVYRAHDPQLGRTVAVKLISPRLRTDPGFDARFRREAQIVSRLNDPHVVVVHDFGIDAAHGPFLVMELLDGRTLRQRLNEDGRLSPAAALQLGEQLMLALAHAHGEGVVHRDLKPDNVFLLAQSELRLHVKVLDFGVATIIGDVTSVGFKTETGASVGTPRYMSPEQLAGKQATPRSDLYAAAVVLFESMTGQIPELMGPRLRERCPAVPVGLEQVIEQCLHGNPDERPVSAAEAYLHLHETAREVRGDLLVPEGVVHQLTARFRPPAVAPPTRRRWLAAAGLVALVPATWWLLPRRHPRAERESLLGLAVGDRGDDVIVKLGPRHGGENTKPGPDFVRLVSGTELDSTPGPSTYAAWPDRSTEAVIVNGSLHTLVVRAPGIAESARRLRLGDPHGELFRAYPERPGAIDVADVEQPPGWCQVYRYPELGLAVEVRNGAVTAMAIFPARKPTAP